MPKTMGMVVISEYACWVDHSRECHFGRPEGSAAKASSSCRHCVTFLDFKETRLFQEIFLSEIPAILTDAEEEAKNSFRDMVPADIVVSFLKGVKEILSALSTVSIDVERVEKDLDFEAHKTTERVEDLISGLRQSFLGNR